MDNGWQRIQQEEWEEAHLAPFAAKSGASIGRKFEEPPCKYRTCFQRDRDRIIHSKAFRRLKHKTQVFIAPEGDHYRTRLTHTLEVAQISRTIARGLRLNEDLTEAIALGHDLGHTPFGHAGEEALNAVTPFEFAHNQQSLRVVEVLERKSSAYPGLNLTYEVRDGILKHTGPELPETLEGQIVRIADRIAYINHDIDDAIRAGLLSEQDLPKEAVEILGTGSGQRIDTLVKDIVQESLGQREIRQSPKVAEAMTNLREFLFTTVYIGSVAKKEEAKAKELLQQLYHYYLTHVEDLVRESGYKGEVTDAVVPRLAADYIAGMTDRYAIHKFLEHFVPHNWRQY
ncbi:MAG: deoxyguanosinetriphosphate triphosphohydrolase [Firmicutes bacterium]|nr:deoxyguanosinetriphosphate triphosphohydrolase [Bacillota bacterium]